LLYWASTNQLPRFHSGLPQKFVVVPGQKLKRESTASVQTGALVNPKIARIYGCSSQKRFYHALSMFEGSLGAKLPTTWTDGKAEVGRVGEEKIRRKKIREEKESEERRYRCAKR